MTKTISLFGALALAVSVSACATTSPPTSEQLASCRQMLDTMGEGATHSHGADKSGGANTMGMTHAQCRRKLARGHPPEPYAARELLVDVPPDRPKAIGISVPGMPDGSPGMERSDGKRAG